MTQKGKCETCRLRKVKCDETKPVCKACLKGDRPCSYRQPNGLSTSDGAGLKLRRIRHAGASQGTFLTLGLQSTTNTVATPTTPLSSLTSRLASRWARMLIRMPAAASASNGMFTRLGHDPTLDAAASYMCDSHQAYMSQDPDDMNQARSSGSKAMSSVRDTINSQGIDCSDFGLLSITLLLSAQYFMGVRKTAHQTHAIALSRILKSRWARGQWRPLEEISSRNVAIEESGASVLANTVSDMDDPQRLKARALAMPEPRTKLARAESSVTDTLVLVPRLAMMVRKLEDGCNDEQLVIDTLNLTKDIYDNPIRGEIEELIGENSMVYDSTSNPLGSCIEYTDDDVFAMANFYGMWRMIICGTIQHLFRLVEPSLISLYFSLDAVETEDAKIAGKTAMSVEFAMRETICPPFNAMRIATPTMMSYGAWSRLEKRHRGGGGNDALRKHAAKMMAFANDSYNRVMAQWHFPPTRAESMEKICSAYCGGPALPELSVKSQLLQQEQICE